MFNSKFYNIPYHSIDLSNFTFLITGGSGFIGSNLVEYLLRYNAGLVRVLDNLSNGYLENIDKFKGLQNFEFIEGDIRNIDVCEKAVQGINYISHQAALGSVPRSISDPLTTNDVNINGFLNILTVAKESKSLKRMVYAASSSTYGDSTTLPKVEGTEGIPLSPYAVTKLVNELYADVYSKVYNFHTIGLRYFNIFGPNQNPNNPYAAVIPLFCKNIIEGNSLIINGNEEITRDFTFVENAVQANIKSLLYSDINKHVVLNVANGNQISLKDLILSLENISKRKATIFNNNHRVGDILHSIADISKIKDLLNYDPKISFHEGLKITFEWMQSSNKLN